MHVALSSPCFFQHTELVDWLAQNHLGAFAKSFQKIGMMSREKLLTFKKPHLEQMGVRDKDQRHKLSKAIKAYKKTRMFIVF